MDDDPQPSRAIVRDGPCGNYDSRFAICDISGYTGVAGANQGDDGGGVVEGTVTEEDLRRLVEAGGGIRDAVVVIHDRPPFDRQFLLYLHLTDRKGYHGLARYRSKGIRGFKTLDAVLGRLEDDELAPYLGDVLLVRSNSPRVADLGLTGFAQAGPRRSRRGRKASKG
jgi:hypothetical protein